VPIPVSVRSAGRVLGNPGGSEGGQPGSESHRRPAGIELLPVSNEPTLRVVNRLLLVQPCSNMARLTANPMVRLFV